MEVENDRNVHLKEFCVVSCLGCGSSAGAVRLLHGHYMCTLILFVVGIPITGVHMGTCSGYSIRPERQSTVGCWCLLDDRKMWQVVARCEG